MGNVQQYIGKRVEVGRYQVEAIKYLGEGGSSYIFLVKDVQRESARPMVLKRLVAENETTMALLQNEIEMHQRFHHPQIVEFHASQVMKKGKEREVLILMEYCPQGHLFENMMKMGEKRFKEQDLLRTFRSLCVPVRVLHQCDPPVAHRDLKLENFLMAQNGTYKLCDFGSCVNGPQSLETKADRAREEEHVLKRTTAMYRSPELADVEGTAMFGQGQLTEAVDIWAMGCVLFTMCFFKPPFPPEGLRTERYTIPKESPYSPSVHQLIGRMLQGDVERRATIDHVIECCDELLDGRPLPKWNGPSPPSPVKKTTAPPSKPIAQEPPVVATIKTTEKRTADKSDLLDMEFNPTISSALPTKINDPFGASDPFSTSSPAGWATTTAPPLSPNSGFANFDAFSTAQPTNNRFGFGQANNSFPTQASHPPVTGFNASPAPTTPIPASFDAFDAIANPVKPSPPTMGFGAMPTQTAISPSARNIDPFAGLNSGMGMGMNMGTSAPGHQGFQHPHNYQQPMGQQQWTSHPPPPPQQQYGQGFSR